MAKGSDLAGMVQALKRAEVHAKAFVRDYPKSRTAHMMKVNYLPKLSWMLKNIVTVPQLQPEVREAIRKEIEADAYELPAIYEKILLLPVDQRQPVEELIEAILNGEEIKIVE